MPTMIIYGFESIQRMLEQEGFLFKLLANESGVVLFPYTTEHRDSAQPGIRYEDDSRGNALAAMVKPGRIEFRFHQKFSDGRVEQLCRKILEIPEMEFARNYTVTYQSRELIVR